MDTVDRKTRSKIMSSVGQKDTGPEKLLRSSLHAEGLRYRLHARELPGSPGLVFPRYRSVVFVHGCYWHSHGCYRSTVPKTRRDFWERKFGDNRERDKRNVALLRREGWRVMIVWECALVGKSAYPPGEAPKRVAAWLEGSEPYGELPKRAVDEVP